MLDRTGNQRSFSHPFSSLHKIQLQMFPHATGNSARFLLRRLRCYIRIPRSTYYKIIVATWG